MPQKAIFTPSEGKIREVKGRFVRANDDFCAIILTYLQEKRYLKQDEKRSKTHTPKEFLKYKKKCF